MRRIIASKMLQSKLEAAQAYMDNDLDASHILAIRDALLPEIEESNGIRVSITDILMFITAAAIKRHPLINTRWTEEGIVYHPYIHMGMAMMLDEGLIVPVIWDIERKGISEIAATRADLTNRGRQGKLTPDEMKGSTFTLSAMGMLGIQRFTGIINQPENAILAVGTITERPWAVGGKVAVRPIMNITLTYDHRTIDGAEAAKFMRTLTKMLENPFLIFSTKVT
jgi:pyruvate dehydrogenase E2 component (dihydrolipoamide acetyltransferase)